jgi:hypothetical protein
LEVKYREFFFLASSYTHYVADGIVWVLKVLSLWLGDKPGEEVDSITPLVLQVYIRDHIVSLDNPNMGTESELRKYHSYFLI